MKESLPEPVVSLSQVAAGILSVAGNAKALAGVAAQAGPVFELRILVDAPQGECRVRLWDAKGGNPIGVENDNWAWSFHDNTNKDRKCRLEDEKGTLFSLADLRHGAVTWSVRMEPLVPDAGERYEVVVELLRDGDPLKKGRFFYSGPLDDLEELTGRANLTD